MAYGTQHPLNPPMESMRVWVDRPIHFGRPNPTAPSYYSFWFCTFCATVPQSHTSHHHTKYKLNKKQKLFYVHKLPS